MPTPSLSQYAGRWLRLLAHFIDALIAVVPGLFIMFFSGFSQGLVPVDPSQPPVFPAGAMLGLMAWFILILIVQLVFLTTRGQTIGKMVIKAKIVMLADGRNGGFVPNVLLRTIVNGLLSMVPFYSIVDILFIFRADRRCIHDLIAGTVVVTA